MAADPAGYMAPASAGLNRKLAPVGNLAPVSLPTRKITVTFSLDTIKAPAPPAAGGGGRWLGGFELTEYYPALESWFAGRPVHAPGLPGLHRIDWLYSGSRSTSCRRASRCRRRPTGPGRPHRSHIQHAGVTSPSQALAPARRRL
jgi:hypothetical protein